MKAPLPDALEDLASETLTVDLCDRELERLRLKLAKTSKTERRWEIRAQMDAWLDARNSFSPEG